MIEPFSYKGIWQIPGNEICVAGVLEYTPSQGIILSIISSFYPDKNLREHIENVDEENAMLIYGQTVEAKHITLINCHVKRTQISSNISVPLIEYSCKHMLIGAEYYNVTETDKFISQVDIHMPFLTYWHMPSETACNYQLSVSDNTIIKLHNKVIEYPNLIPYYWIKENRRMLTIEARDGVAIVDSLKYAESLTLFFTFVAQELSPIYSIHFRDNKKQDIIYYPGKSSYAFPIKQKPRFLFIYDTFKRPEFTTSLDSILLSWLQYETNLAPIRKHLVTSIINNKQGFLSSNFIILAHAIDGFHRRFRNSKKQRYLERIESLKSEFDDIFPIRKLEINAQEIKNSRDYYTHYFTESEVPSIFNDRELAINASKLQKLLVCCFLDLLGFTHTEISIILSRYYPLV